MSDYPEPADSLDPERYDRRFEQPWRRHAVAVARDALLDVLGLLDGRELVELGCGTGRFTAAFERAGAEVTGVDNDPGMLARAASRTASTLVRRRAHPPAVRRQLRRRGGGHAARVLHPPAAHRRRAGAGHTPWWSDRRGHLNPRSPSGLAHRRELRNPPWSSARLTTRRQLRELLAGHGGARLHGALHAPGIRPGLAWLARVTEHAGRWAPGIGVFQIAVLDLPEPAR